VGLNNTYGDILLVVYLDETITGSDFSDVMTVGTVNYDPVESEGAGFWTCHALVPSW